MGEVHILTKSLRYGPRYITGTVYSPRLDFTVNMLFLLRDISGFQSLLSGNGIRLEIPGLFLFPPGYHIK